MTDFAYAHPHYISFYHQCVPHFKYITKTLIKEVVPRSYYMYSVIGGFASLLVGFGLGWYVKGRGLTGVKTDMTNASNEVSKVATEVSAIKA